MSVAALQPQILQNGLPLEVTASPWPSPSQADWVLLSNNTPVNIQINTYNGVQWLYANTIGAFRTGGTTVTAVAAVGSLPTGLIIGSLSATYVSSDEADPVGYPQQLVQFPGGGVQLIGGDTNSEP